MEWLLWGYGLGAVAFMGLAVAAQVKKGNDPSVVGCAFVGLIWPVMFFAVIAYALSGGEK